MNRVAIIIVSMVLVAITGCSTVPWGAEAAIHKKDYETAVNRYTKEIKKQPQYHSIIGRAYAYSELGRYKEAMTDFAKARSIKPRDGGIAALGEARMALKLGEFDRASDAADDSLKANDANTDAYFIRGIVAVRQKDYEQGKSALLIIKDKFDLKTDDGLKLLKNLATACLHLQNFSQAKQYYNEYMVHKQATGRYLLEDDYYWAGAIADVNLDDEGRDKYWNNLSTKYKKQRGIN